MEANTDDGGRCILHNGDCSHRSSVDTEAEALALVSAFPNPDMCNFSSAVCGGAIRDMMMGRPRNIFDGFWYEQAGGLIAVIVVPIVLVCICIGICVLCICWKQAVVVVHHQGGKHLPALKHQRRRSACICQHQRIRSRCKECGWASTCARQAHARSAVGRASASSAGGRASACTSSTCTECGGLCPLAPAPKEPMQGVRGASTCPHQRRVTEWVDG